MTLLASALGGCKNAATEPVDPTQPPGGEPPLEKPFTAIPDEFVGTWYAYHNQGPLTDNWTNGTFQGEQGFREFRTMVFTGDGRNAVEYTSQVYNYGDETLQIIYKVTGTLVYKASPASITFHAQTGIRRTFSNKYSGYKDASIIAKDLKDYQIVWENPQATNMSSMTNYLTTTIIDQSGRYASKYQKLGAGNQTPTTGLPSTTPITTGTSVKIGNLYYPTVTIGNQEWLATNYAGPGSLTERNKPQYGTFLEYADLAKIQLPAGWRIPSRQDYTQLLESQGLTVYDWGTNGEDVPSKRMLGQLMATDAWTKKDGYANNKSGFNAMPADVRRPKGVNHGEGTNCTLWISDRNSSDNPMSFNIIQLPGDTYATFGEQVLGYAPVLIPLRLVRNK
ncbi:FISUMP domain-containing protein [Fibrella sp. WM1]|uniref:FISUMP domain-containing protein n=1 Tax=Fibrella musci TaxID=3242485 RepID=UPI003521393E